MNNRIRIRELLPKPAFSHLVIKFLILLLVYEKDGRQRLFDVDRFVQQLAKFPQIICKTFRKLL